MNADPRDPYKKTYFDIVEKIKSASVITNMDINNANAALLKCEELSLSMGDLKNAEAISVYRYKFLKDATDYVVDACKKANHDRAKLKLELRLSLMKKSRAKRY